MSKERKKKEMTQPMEEEQVPEKKKLSELSWGWISGMALGIGSSLGVAWESWTLFIVVSVLITLFMVRRARRIPA